QPSHQYVVVDPVEKLLQVYVHHPAATFLDVLPRRSHGIVRAAPRPKAIAVLGKRRIESRLEHLQDALLDESVENRRNPQPPDSAASLRDRLPFHWLRLVGPGQ